MEYVLTENGNIKITDGKPTVKDGDKEFGIDAIGANDRITVLTSESNDRRKKLGEATTSLASFKGIEDPVAAIEALQTVASMDGKHKTDIDELKKTINTAWSVKEVGWETEKTKLEADLFDAKVGSKFASSKAVKTTTLTPKIAAQVFGSQFKTDGTAVDISGNVIYSKENPGEAAEFEEALTFIIDNYPDKESIMKGSGFSGSGGHQGGDGGSNTPEKTSIEKIASGLKSLNN